MYDAHNAQYPCIFINASQRYDRAAHQLVSFPIREYESLRNATVINNESDVLAPGTVKQLAIPPRLGGALDLEVSFSVGDAGGVISGFGLSVRAPNDGNLSNAALALVLTLSAAGTDGTRNLSVVDVGAGPWAPPSLHRVNDGTNSTSDDGVDDFNHLTSTNGPHVVPTVRVLAGETINMRVLVDRPVIELFVMSGRAATTLSGPPFRVNATAVFIFNQGKTAVTTVTSAHGMGCGWAGSLPVPYSTRRD